MLLTGVPDARAKGISTAGVPANVAVDTQSDSPSTGRHSGQDSNVGTTDWVRTPPPPPPSMVMMMVTDMSEKTSEPVGEDDEGSFEIPSTFPSQENATTAAGVSSAMPSNTTESGAQGLEGSSEALSPGVENPASTFDAPDKSESVAKDATGSSGVPSPEALVTASGTSPAIRDPEESSKTPSSPGLTTPTAGTSPPTEEKSAEPAAQEPEQTSKPPSSPRLKPMHSFPDAHVPEPMDLPSVQAGHDIVHSYVVPALEPVLEETPKGTHLERFAGEAYLDEEELATTPGKRKGKGKAVDWDGVGGKVVAIKTGGQKKLHAFEEGNTTKARQRGASPPPSPGTEGNPSWRQTTPSTPPLTNTPLDRTTSPTLPPSPSKVRWEPIRPFPNRAQHTEHSAGGPYEVKGVYHEAGAGGMTFTQQGGMWIGKPPVPLDGVAMQAAGGQDRGEKMGDRERDVLMAKAEATSVATRATAAAPSTSSTPAAQPPMLPFIPRIFAPQLTLDFQWADTWLPSDVTLETPTEAHTISLYDSIRNWTGLAAFAPSKRITNTDTR